MGKSGIMHMRKKLVERCEVEYKVDGEVIPMVSSYVDRQIITGYYANQLATPVLVSQQAGGPKS